jgi:hypothetical protein
MRDLWRMTTGESGCRWVIVLHPATRPPYGEERVKSNNVYVSAFDSEQARTTVAKRFIYLLGQRNYERRSNCRDYSCAARSCR